MFGSCICIRISGDSLATVETQCRLVKQSSMMLYTWRKWEQQAYLADELVEAAQLMV